jgi:IS5 family transposase
MRTSHRRQTPLLVPQSSHPRAKELAAVDRLLEANPELAERVAADLVGRRGASTDVGRPGLTGDQVLRAAIIRVLEECSYEDLEFHLSDSQSYRWFCRIGWGQPSPSASTLQENIRRVLPETWTALNVYLVGQAVALGVETGRKVRIDCTVTESNIHPPDDAAQLYDVVRVLVRLLRRAEKLRAGITVHGRTKRAKRRRLETMGKKDDARKAAYRDLLRVTDEVLGWAATAIVQLRDGTLTGDDASRLADEIAAMATIGEHVVDQTRRRVVEKEKVPAQDKVVSVFEPHTDIIIKDRRQVLYGHKLLLATGASGMVVHCDVLDGNPADSTLVGPSLDGVARSLGAMPKQAALDGGFASKEGLALAKAKGVEDVCFSKRRGMQIADMAKSTWVYRKLWRFRAGIEAGISLLKRCFGLDRARWKQADGFHAYVHSSVVAFNILLLGRLAEG